MRAKYTNSLDGTARRNISITLRLTEAEVAKLDAIRKQDSSAKSLNEFLNWKLQDAIFMTVEYYDNEQAAEKVVLDYVQGTTNNI